MSAPAPSDVRRWSDELARDPGSPVFVPLSDAYRRQGRRDAALRVCLRGLERHPTHVAGHALLARLYLEAGDRQRACDEWSMVLRLEPENFEANRGMGFYFLERRDWPAAERHLLQAERQRPDDRAVREGLRVLGQRWRRAASSGATGGATSGAAAAGRNGGGNSAAAAGRNAGSNGAVRSADPARVFEPLAAEPPFRGGLILDAQGLVLAGAVAGGGAEAEALGALLDGVLDEARRAALLLDLGGWRSLLLETGEAVVAVSPLEGDFAVVVVAAAATPAGWMRRTAARAAELACSFVEAMP